MSIRAVREYRQRELVFQPWLAGVIALGLGLLGAGVLPRRVSLLLVSFFAGFARRHWTLSLAALGGLVIAVRLSCVPAIPPPVPLIPDEHSHILLARTLAAGRFSTPTHPMWRHFETLFVLHRPAYASAYPPLQGALLAAGLALFGAHWAGVLASMGAMCIAVAWMIRAYLTPSWALYGGLLAASGFGVLSYWTNSYWGGAGAAIGGAMVFGALPRILSKSRLTHAVILILGLLMLANSRPYEGLLATLPVAFCLLVHFVRREPSRWAFLRIHAPALALVALGGAALTCWYNWRVTGSPLRLPHTAYIEQYAVAPAFVWQTPRSVPAYADAVLRESHLSFSIDYTEYSTISGFVRKSFGKLAKLAPFYWGPFWIFVFLGFPDFLRDRRLRVVLLSLAFCVGGSLLTVGFQLHYLAPCTSVFILLLTDSFRRICRQLPRFGAALVIAAPAVWIGAQALTLRPAQTPNSLMQRPAVQSRLLSEPGGHVVFVRYAPSHPLGQEWVYNEPDIDGSRIIWARDLGPDFNRELIRYYQGRTFWLAEPDYSVPRLSRCTPGCQTLGSGGAPFAGVLGANTPGPSR